LNALTAGYTTMKLKPRPWFDIVEQVQKRSFFRANSDCLKTRSFYQDRLGTNLGKVWEKDDFEQVEAIAAAVPPHFKLDLDANATWQVRPRPPAVSY
jgi:L-alanine-DL-glutamate epimerase-like enolase superfamily enzyme